MVPDGLGGGLKEERGREAFYGVVFIKKRSLLQNIMNFYTASNLPRVPKPWGIAANKPKAKKNKPSDPVPSQTPRSRASTHSQHPKITTRGILPNSPYGDLEDLVEFALQQRRLQHTQRRR